MDDLILKNQFNLFNEKECPEFIIQERIMIYEKLEIINFTIYETILLSDIVWKYNEDNYRIPFFKEKKQDFIRLNENENIFDYLSSSTILPMNEIISGEKIASTCDIFLSTNSGIISNPNIDKFISNIQLIDSSYNLNSIDKIFVKSEDLPILYQKYNLEDKIIVSHNSDHGVDISMISNLKNVNKQFSQNCSIIHPKLIPLPIGIENTQWFDHNILERVRTNKNIKKDKDIYFFFNIRTHFSRVNCYTKLQRKLTWNKPLNKEDYFIELKRHKYAICPRGNGLDTHRLWECLYLDVIPIMVKSDDINISGLPIVFFENWNQFHPYYLTNSFKNLEMKKITYSYYNELIQKSNLKK